VATFGDDQIGRVLGERYRIVAPVGTGASATVFLAEDTQLRRQVAVKLLHPSLADDTAFLKRFRAEAQAAAALSHPNLLQVFDWGQDREVPYLVTEYLGGGSLRAMLDRGRRLSPSQALVVGLEAARGLDYAHRRGFVHRDIKPANLLFGGDGRLRIGDFGLARAVAEAAWTEPAGVVLGTARYASPEQAKGLPVDGRTDVYSLALSLVEAVTGQVPFAADTTVATLMNRLDKLMPVSADLGALAPVLERAGRPDPAERYDAGELGRALVQTAERLPRPQPLPLVATMPGPRRDDTDLTGLFGAAPPPPRPGDSFAVGPSVPLGVAAGVAGGGGATTVAPTIAVPASPRLEPVGPSTKVMTATGAPATAVLDRGAPPPSGGGKPRRAKRRRPWAWLFGLLAVAVLAAGVVAGVLYVQEASTPSYPVPNLVGLEEARALNFIGPNGWATEVVKERNDEVETGRVFKQDPTTGKLEKGAPFKLWVSQGPTLSPIPDVQGKTKDEAQALLAEQKLKLNVVGEQFDENAPKGTIIGWGVANTALAPGTEVVKGTTIDAVLSSGPAPRNVPKVVGKPYDAAKASIEQVGLVVARADDVFSDSVPAGAVVSASPGVGEQVARGGTVTLTVSKGPDVVKVPTLIGLPLPDAAAAIQQAGLTVGDIAGPDAGKVVAVDPKEGTTAKRGTRVNLLLG
jgi:eukaryotic-like serine/threonine-protein kinase